MNRYPDAVIFDLDGVITDTAEHHYQAWKRLAESLSVPFDHEFNHQLRGLSRMESLQRILQRGGLAFSESECEAFADKKNGWYKELISELTPADILEQIKPLLETLRKAGIKTAIASASKNSRSVLGRLELLDAFDAIADGTCVSKSKPDPAVFLCAAEMLGVAPARCVGVEDAQAGVTAINAAGMVAIGIGEAEILHEAKRVIPGTKYLTLDLISEVYCGKS